MDLGNLDYIEIFRSSFTLMILLVCSILAVAFMIERWLFYRRAKVDSTRFLSRIKMSLENNNFQEAVSTCERDRSPVAAVLRVGLLNRALPYHQLDELMHTTREEERVKLGKNRQLHYQSSSILDFDVTSHHKPCISPLSLKCSATISRLCQHCPSAKYARCKEDIWPGTSLEL